MDLNSPEYIERVYAGVLGKIIGVYLGRPIEGMFRTDIEREFGKVDRYIHEQRQVPLVVTDDDITGTFTFVRALEDCGSGAALTSRDIGETWLNYIIENKTILWWGGIGMSTEQTAFHRLKNGIPAPRSGSAELNSKVVSEQIGSQIFIDSWAMVCPGDPAQAVRFAAEAARVSHDGEAVFAAQVIAAMEAAAFTEPDLQALLEIGLCFIPERCVIAEVIRDLRAAYSRETDWRVTMANLVEKKYGYDRFGGNCHVVPNHAVVILALLYGNGNFRETLSIANTCGWDTDCNSGNVGCLVGILSGLDALQTDHDWRGPVADRIFLPTADGGSCISDAVIETYRLVNIARRLRGLAVLSPKNGARFHFSLPGSVQGWRLGFNSNEGTGKFWLGNIKGKLVLEAIVGAASSTVRIGTSVFSNLEELVRGGYGMYACPTLYPGQILRASVSAPVKNSSSIGGHLFVDRFKGQDRVGQRNAEPFNLAPGESLELNWTIPDLGGYPILGVGLELSGNWSVGDRILVDSVGWSGDPTLVVGNSKQGGVAATKQWVNACDSFSTSGKTQADQAFVMIQNSGTGMAIYGTREWRNYRVAARMTPHLARRFGICARVQGLRRYYALLLVHPNRAQLVKVLGHERVLAEADFAWRWNDDPHTLAIEAINANIRAFVDGNCLFEATDFHEDLSDGGIALALDEGRLGICPVTVMAL